MEEMKTCARPGCGNTFPPGTGKTKNKVYCSDDCRYTAYRTNVRDELLRAIDKAVKAKVRL